MAVDNRDQLLADIARLTKERDAAYARGFKEGFGPDPDEPLNLTPETLREMAEIHEAKIHGPKKKKGRSHA